MGCTKTETNQTRYIHMAKNKAKMIGSFCDVEACIEKAAWFDQDPRDPKGFVALCEKHYQDPTIARFYHLHLENGVLVRK